MRHGSLFSGMGGFDLAAEWMGWENIFHCEWNEFGQKILKHYWPRATSYGDITTTDFTVHRGKIDILTGGFPCQPYSTAGKRKGKEDERHLWPEMLRAIREIAPPYIVGENVRGLVNWNGGLVFDEVQSDLEAEGYEVLPFLLPACSLNAPHRRDRIWFVANSINGRDFGYTGKHEGKGEEERLPERNEVQQFEEPSNVRPQLETFVADPTISGLQGVGNQGISKEKEHSKSKGLGRASSTTDTNSVRQPSKEYREKKPGRFAETGVFDYWQNFPTQSPVCDGDDGFPPELDGITFPKWRNESIKAGGNAIVPQVAFEIFKAIEKTKTQNP